MTPEALVERVTGGFDDITGQCRRDLVRQALSALGEAVARGRRETCPRCHGYGGYRGTDAAGSADWLTCRTCQGWTVVEGRKP